MRGEDPDGAGARVAGLPLSCLLAAGRAASLLALATGCCAPTTLTLALAVGRTSLGSGAPPTVTSTGMEATPWVRTAPLRGGWRPRESRALGLAPEASCPRAARCGLPRRSLVPRLVPGRRLLPVSVSPWEALLLAQGLGG